VSGDAVLGVGFTPAGRLLTVDRLGEWRKATTRLWDARTGTPVGVLARSAADEDAVLSPDGRSLLQGVGKELRVLHLPTGKVISLRGHNHSVAAVAVGRSGRRAITGSHDRTGRVWDLARGVALARLAGHTDRVQGVCLAPDERLAATASCDGTVRIWEAATGRQRHVLRGHHGEVAAVHFSPDGRRLASGGADGTVRVWDPERGRELLSLEGHRGLVRHVAFSPDGQRLLSAGDDRTVRVWDATPLPES
jgi:WD40 repeat protein